MWSVAAAALGQFSGNMKRQSETWNGLLSNLGDNIGAVFREFGAPIMESLKPLLGEIVNYTTNLAATAASLARRSATLFAWSLRRFLRPAWRPSLALAADRFYQGAEFHHGRASGTRLRDAFAFRDRTSTSHGLHASHRESLALVWPVASASKHRRGLCVFLSSALAPVLDKLVGILNKIPGVNIDLARPTSLARPSKPPRIFSAAALPRWPMPLRIPRPRWAIPSRKASPRFQDTFSKAPEFLSTDGLTADFSSLVAGLQKTVDANMATAGVDVQKPKGTDVPTATKLVSSTLAQLGLGGLVGGGSTLIFPKRVVRPAFRREWQRGIEKLAAGGQVSESFPYLAASRVYMAIIQTHGARGSTDKFGVASIEVPFHADTLQEAVDFLASRPSYAGLSMADGSTYQQDEAGQFDIMAKFEGVPPSSSPSDSGAAVFRFSGSQEKEPIKTHRNSCS